MKWSWVRKIGKTKLVELTIFVPVIGYFILLNENISQYLTFMKEILPIEIGESERREIELSRLYFVYFGLTFLGIGELIFKLRCPREIQEFESDADYISKRCEFVTIYSLEKIRNETLELLPSSGSEHNELKEINTGIQDKPSANPGHSVWINTNKAGIFEIFSRRYNVLNKSNKRSIFFVLFLFIAGFVLLAIPSAATTYNILKVLFC